jgi:hypothetical protein
MESRASQVRIVASRTLPGKVRDPLAEDSHNPTNLRLFVRLNPGRDHGGSRALRIGRFILRGGGPFHELPLIEVSRNRTCLMFRQGTHLAVGQIYEIVRPIRIRDDFGRWPVRPRKVVARVKILGIEGETRAIVHVLNGSVIRGYWAERVEMPRIEARAGLECS